MVAAMNVVRQVNNMQSESQTSTGCSLPSGQSADTDNCNHLGGIVNNHGKCFLVY